MAKAQEYISKAQQIWHQAKTIMDAYEGKEMPKEKDIEVEKMFNEIEDLQRKSDNEIREEKTSKFFTEPQRNHPIGSENEKAKKESHQKAFKSYLRLGKVGMEPEERKLLSSLSDPEGGVLVTEDFRTELIRKRRDLVQIRQFATVIETSRGSVGFPVFDFDGSAEWTAESTQITEEDVTNAFGKTNFVPHKLARIFRVPIELAEDSAINIESLMTDHFSMRFGEIEENAFINGDGVGKPLGLLESGLNTFSATGVGGTFQADDLFDIVYNIRAVYRQNASWMMHRNAIRRIRKFKDSQGQYLWQPSIQAGEPATILGFPLIESEFFPDNVDAGSAGNPLTLFGDLSFYWIVERIDMSVQRLIEKYAEFDQIGFKMRMRADGSPVKKDPFQVLVRGA